jgi:hypothetical protein
MRFFTARRVALAALFPALLSLSIIPGCSQQGEGERCGTTVYGPADSEDCGDGLTCTAYGELLNGSIDKANRCCFTGRKPSDSRCTLMGSSSSSSGGASGGGAGGASAGTGDTAGATDDETTFPEAGAGGV